MKVKEDSVRNLFVALGREDYADVVKVPRKRLQTRLQALPTLAFPKKVEELGKPERSLYRRICDALAEGPVTLEGEPLPPEAAPTIRAPKTNQGNGKVHAGNGVVKSGAGRDRWGARAGSISYRINATLTPSPKTAEKIAKAAGVSPARVAQHFNFWRKAKRGIGPHFVSTADGYALKQ